MLCGKNLTLKVLEFFIHGSSKLTKNKKQTEPGNKWTLLSYVSIYIYKSSHHFYVRKLWLFVITSFFFSCLSHITLPVADKCNEVTFPHLSTWFSSSSSSLSLPQIIKPNTSHIMQHFMLLKILQKYYLLWICQTFCVTGRANAVSLSGLENWTG